MGNKISYGKRVGDYNLIMVLGYVENGKCSLFLRDDNLNTIHDFGIVSVEFANFMFENLNKKEN
jgi:hypothetical protein